MAKDERNSGYLPVRPDWLARHAEEVIEPELPIVDPHHHVWDVPEWQYLFPQLLADLRCGHNIRQTVFVQCYSMYRAGGRRELRSLGETEFVNGVAAMFASGLYGDVRACSGIIGAVDLRLGAAVPDILQRHIAAAGSRFRGVRQLAAHHDDPRVQPGGHAPPHGILRDPAFQEGVRHLHATGLALDVWVYHTQLDDVVELARHCPDGTIVLNHAGGPIGVGPFTGKRDEVYAVWSDQMARVAHQPNVYVKLGGLGMRSPGFDFHEADIPPSSETLAQAWRPYVERCIQAFGPERCMFESNFPVDKGSCSYLVLWNAFKRLAAGYGPAEKAALFSDTARKAYALPAQP